MSRRLCIDAKPGYVIATITASYKYLAIVYESLKQFTNQGCFTKPKPNDSVYYLECYEINDSYDLHKICNMRQFTVKNTECLVLLDITLLIDDDLLYVFSHQVYDFAYGHAELTAMFKLTESGIHPVTNTLSESEVKKFVEANTKSHAVYSVMDHECKYYDVKYVHGEYRTYNSPYRQSTIQLTSKQSAFMVGKLNKSGHASANMREFAIHDVTHVTQVIMRGEFTGLESHGRKLEVYPAFIADSRGNIQLTYLRPDTKAEFTAWNLYYHILGGELNGFPYELLEIIAGYS
jgi:hypothetical protein